MWAHTRNHDVPRFAAYACSKADAHKDGLTRLSNIHPCNQKSNAKKVAQLTCFYWTMLQATRYNQHQAKTFVCPNRVDKITKATCTNKG
jgi:hypothetical protein